MVNCRFDLAYLVSNSGTLTDKPLEHLATVMRLYSKRSFTRDVSQWTKCVVKYVHDTYPGTMSQLLGFLTEVGHSWMLGERLLLT